MDHNQQRPKGVLVHSLPIWKRIYYATIIHIVAPIRDALEPVILALAIMTFGILKPHKTETFAFALRDQARRDTEESERCLLETTTVYSQINALYLEIDEEFKQLMALVYSPDAELRLDEVRAYVSEQVDKTRAVEALEERASSLGMPAQRSQWALLSGAWREAW